MTKVELDWAVEATLNETKAALGGKFFNNSIENQIKRNVNSQWEAQAKAEVKVNTSVGARFDPASKLSD